MINRIKSVLVTILMVLPMLSYAQQEGAVTSSLAYLENNFPKLTEMYRKELSKYPAHYVFAIDVSGTMDKYEADVLGSLRPFFEALPDKDRVDVIPFGEGALSNMLQYSGIIDAGVKSTLISNLGNFYHDPNYPDGFKRYTYVDAAVEAITKSLSTNRDYKVNIVVILTDFWNENPQSRLFTDEELESMHDAFDAASNGVYTRAIALSLPVNPKAKNVLPQLKEKVFCDAERGLEIVPMGQNSNMIRQWFDQLKREIMVDKLRAVISSENRVNNAVLKVDIDIDGNTTAEIHWTPTKLYPSMKIDSTYLAEQGWYFKNNKEAYVNTRDSVIGVDPKLELGKIVNDSYFFHHLQDSLHMGIYLPTEYDDELKNLNIRKPIPATTRAVDEWIFTFFLPFWLCVAIIILLIIYIIGIFKAIGRNNEYKLGGKVTVSADGEPLDGFPAKVAPCTTLNIGAQGTGRMKVAEANWNIVINKVNGNIFASYFCKPHFEWHATRGYAADGARSISGELDHGSILAVRAGKNRNEIENAIKMQVIKP